MSADASSAGELMMVKYSRLALGALIGMVPLTVAAQDLEEAGDPTRGRLLAVERCGGCHAVDPDQAQQGAGGRPPSFTALADRADHNADRLLALLQTLPHPPMPTPRLNRQEWRDVVAYVM